MCFYQEKKQKEKREPCLAAKRWVRGLSEDLGLKSTLGPHLQRPQHVFFSHHGTFLWLIMFIYTHAFYPTQLAKLLASWQRFSLSFFLAEGVVMINTWRSRFLNTSAKDAVFLGLEDIRRLILKGNYNLISSSSGVCVCVCFPCQRGCHHFLFMYVWGSFSSRAHRVESGWTPFTRGLCRYSVRTA